MAGVGYLRWRGAVMGMLVVCGASMVTCLALCNTSIQQRVPDAMRGRVLSMYTFSFYAFLPFGNLASGMLAEHRGIGLTLLLLGGALVISSLIAAIVIIRRKRDRTLLGEVAVPIEIVDTELVD